MIKTYLSLNDNLPLTCSRKGSCCFGKNVLINPWELATLAYTKGYTIEAFIAEYCENGGTKLIFNGSTRFKNYNSCSLYLDNFGCSLHKGRPLACRLYPLGKQTQNKEVVYVYEGNSFPCLEDCSEVEKLPYMSVDEYLTDQKAKEFEVAQDSYLEITQSIADIAFTILLETDLSSSEQEATLSNWNTLNGYTIQKLIDSTDKEWLKWLISPQIEYSESSIQFAEKHAMYIQTQIQEKLNQIQNNIEYSTTSSNAFSIALILAYSLGVDYSHLGKHWVDLAINLI